MLSTQVLGKRSRIPIARLLGTLPDGDTILDHISKGHVKNVFQRLSPRRMQSLAHKCAQTTDCKRVDDIIQRYRKTEYDLFEDINNAVHSNLVHRETLTYAHMYEICLCDSQRRKVRSGLSFEHHVEKILRDAGCHVESQVKVQDASGRTHRIDFRVNHTIYISVKTKMKERYWQAIKEVEAASGKCDAFYVVTLDNTPQRGKELRQQDFAKLVVVGLEESHPHAISMEDMMRELQIYQVVKQLIYSVI